MALQCMAREVSVSCVAYGPIFNTSSRHLMPN